jgi:16S rRNA (adenine1518-N6/adenine1519-N6)-dimethyltransferase
MVRLGQHFLHDPNIVRKIIRLASIKPDETVLEIGPGRGILTQALSEAVPQGQVIAIELDPELHRLLAANLRDSPNVRLIREDALTYSFESLPGPLKVVANLPYYIATPLLFRLLEVRNKITEMILMLQREVAERITAAEGSKTYSPLSVAVQFYAQPHLAFIVPKGCFSPRPKVDSAVIRLVIRPVPKVKVIDEAFFHRVVQGSFAHRRKMLKNSLKDYGFKKEVIEKAHSLWDASGGLDLNRRAETLTLEEFARLSDILFELTSRM